MMKKKESDREKTEQEEIIANQDQPESQDTNSQVDLKTAGNISLAQKLEQKSAECEDLKNKYLRLGAEFENARKRWDRDREDVIKYANFGLLQSVLTFVDEISEALKVSRAHCESQDLVKGLEIMQSNLLSLLTKKGVSEIEAKGKDFNPHFHEIVTSCPVEKSDQDHTVIEEVQRGYVLGDKVLRTAKVIVGIYKQSAQTMPQDELASQEIEIETETETETERETED